MSMNLRCKAVLLGLALTAAAVAFAPAAMATPVNYNFTVDVISGPLTGTTDHGTFSYDGSSIVPGGFNSATWLVSSLPSSGYGTTWNAGTANIAASTSMAASQRPAGPAQRGRPVIPGRPVRTGLPA